MSKLDELDLLNRMGSGMGLEVTRYKTGAGPSRYRVTYSDKSIYVHEDAGFIQAFLKGYEIGVGKKAD